ncbi:hypothetical protein BH11PLA2_BH11PLA2_12740 [soil metagenome]
MTRNCFVGVLMLFALTATAAEPFQPDPASVRRYGNGYRYPQHGWTVIHIEGEPYERGFQHGKLLSKEVEANVRSLAVQQSKLDPENAWSITRTMVGAVFLKKFDKEFLEEMQGIADGAATDGAKFDKRPVDLLDIVCLNVQMEYETLDNAVDATPTGLEGMRFPKPAAKVASAPAKDHCSAFAATGPATADGKLVIGHITMSGLANALCSNVWIDIKPANGHRIVMQGFPGAIWSGQDYYINGVGLVMTETTIRQTRFNADGVPLTNRCRKAMQYGNTIDDVVKILLEKNNGLYTNEWLIGDANTNEIAAFELGSSTHKLRRSSKNEWILPGTEGFFWGCNNTKDLAMRLDTQPGTVGRPQDVTWVPSIRDKYWLKLYDQHRGKVDADFGKLAFATPPLAAIHSMDAKVTTAAMAKQLQSHALFGPPSHKVWEITDREKAKYVDVRSVVPNDWTVLTPMAPKKLDDVAKIADFGDKLKEKAEVPHTKPAWHGTLLPKNDHDTWLTAGFAAYERIVALENALKERNDGKLKKSDQEQIDLDLFKYKAQYHAARAALPLWKQPTTSPDGLTTDLMHELDRDRWYEEKVALGVLVLGELRKKVGNETFDKSMDEIGREMAGQTISLEDFQTHLVKSSKSFQGRELETREFFDKAVSTGPRPVNVTAWMKDPDNVVIVYGTTADIAGNKAAALALVKAFREKWTNMELPVLADKDAKDDALKGKHVILIGRAETNPLSKKYAEAFPVKFGPASATVNGKTYAHERTTVIVGGVNPIDNRYSVILVNGFSADATYCAAQSMVHAPHGEVVIYPRGGSAVPLVVKK